MHTDESISQRIRQIDQIAEQFNDLLGHDVKVARRDSQVHDPEAIDTQIARLQAQGRVLQIGIIGRVKAGKSSLLNAIFFDGKIILPEAATPMTAALTTLSYGERPAVRIEFFTQQDMEVFRRLHEEHEAAIDECAAKKEAQMLAKGAPSHKTSAGQRMTQQEVSFATIQIDRQLRELARREIDAKDAVGAAAYSLWSDVKTGGGRSRVPTGEKRMEFKSVDVLQGQLAEYVGAKGRLTPFTKCLHLELPFESLRDLRVVDTPGLNDPVLSREARTKDMLKECDAAFVVSPAGQFLNAQDMDLLDRLGSREGVNEIYVFASQFDTQLFGDEFRVCGGRLPDVMDMQRSSLARQAKNVFSGLAVSRPEFRQLIGDSQRRVQTTSSVAFALSRGEQAEWNESAKHIQARLVQKYPDYFSSVADSQTWLQNLSGLPVVTQALADVRFQKELIFSKRISAYFEGQASAGRKYVELLIDSVRRRQADFETADIAAVDEKLKHIELVCRRGTDKADVVFQDEMKRMNLSIGRELRNIVSKKFTEVAQETDAAKSTTTARYEKSGFSSWFARKAWGGGYEDRPVSAIDATTVRRAIEGFRSELEADLREKIEERSLDWPKVLAKDLLAGLRETVGDDSFDVDAMRKIVRSVLMDLSNLPMPDLPVLPDQLMESGKITSSRADEFEKAAEAYAKVLSSAGDTFVGSVKARLKTMSETSVGDAIFGDLRKEAQDLKTQLSNKRTTAERYQRSLGELQKAAG